MTQETINRIHKIYGIVLSVVAVITGILFIVSANAIYRTGLAADVQPFTYATIGAAFSRIAIPVYLCLALVLGGWILDAVLPREKARLKAEKNLPLMLSRLQAKTDMAQLEAGLCASIEKLEKGRKIHAFISGLLLGLSSVLFLSYACNGANWPAVEEASKITDSMITAVFALLICLALPFVYSVFTVFYCRKSLSKQVELMRQASAAAPFKGERPTPKQSSLKPEMIVRYAVLCFALAIMVYGLFTGGTVDVLAKAAAICTECVGLG